MIPPARVLAGIVVSVGALLSPSAAMAQTPHSFARSISAQASLAMTHVSLGNGGSAFGIGPHVSANASLLETLRGIGRTGDTRGFAVQDWLGLELGFGALRRSDPRADDPVQNNVWIDFHVTLGLRFLVPVGANAELYLLPAWRTGLNNAREAAGYGSSAGYDALLLGAGFRNGPLHVAGWYGRGGFADGTSTLMGELAYHASGRGLFQWLGLRTEVNWMHRDDIAQIRQIDFRLVAGYW